MEVLAKLLDVRCSPVQAAREPSGEHRGLNNYLYYFGVPLLYL